MTGVTPHNLDAEKAILGAALLDLDAALAVVESIRTPAQFFREPHQQIYRGVDALVQAGQPVDALTVTAWLERRGKLEAVGGKAYVMSLVDGLPRRSNIGGYLAIVHDCALRRKLLAAGQKVLALAEDAEHEASAALDLAQAELFALTDDSQRGDLQPVEAFVPETREVIERLLTTKAGVTGVSTGFIDVDSYTRGLQRKNLILVAARPSMGKTALALNIAAHAAARGLGVAFFSLEMSREELMLRLISSVGKIDGHRLQAGYVQMHEFPEIGDTLDRIGTWPLWIDDTARMTVIDIRGRTRRLAAKQRIACVMVDYLQLVASDRRYDSRVLELAAMTRALKSLAKDLDVAVVALSQLSRATEARKGHRPELSDLRESGSLEQDADLVLLIYREEHYTPKPENEGVAQIIIAKQRNGPTGTVRLHWQKEFTRFDNRS